MRRLLPALLALLLIPVALAQELTIAAAADLSYCLDDLNATFKQSHPGIDIKVSTGSSGNFYAQIANGGPFDVFMSADMGYPQKLIDAGQADGKTLMRYAIGKLAIWTLDSKLDLSAGLTALRQPEVKRIAIASPEHAPYGRAAQQALEKAKLWDELQPRIVRGENISQTAQFVQTGNVDAGIVALSLLKAPKLQGVGHWVLVPLDAFPQMDQGAVVTQRGQANPLAAAYLAFLASPQARTIFNRYGFELPTGNK
ncbi:MAG: molybdate ABC transporter substrate-binding protein [Burkholderiales bacterium]|nr:molybdate ABC transporter substrate-binding protein [Burkholderiales bacterium]